MESSIETLNMKKNQSDSEGRSVPTPVIFGVQDRIKESMQASMKKKLVKPKVKPTKSDNY
jgi:hypothetical protein